MGFDSEGYGKRLGDGLTDGLGGNGNGGFLVVDEIGSCEVIPERLAWGECVIVEANFVIFALGVLIGGPIGAAEPYVNVVEVADFGVRSKTSELFAIFEDGDAAGGLFPGDEQVGFGIEGAGRGVRRGDTATTWILVTKLESASVDVIADLGAQAEVVEAIAAAARGSELAPGTVHRGGAEVEDTRPRVGDTVAEPGFEGEFACAPFGGAVGGHKTIGKIGVSGFGRGAAGG